MEDVASPPASRSNSSNPPDCSVVIPTYNGRVWLEGVLASIRRHWPDPQRLTLEVIVADDASTDGTASWLANAYPEVVVVRNPVNQGFCGAANLGLSVARGRVVQLLNNDTEVTEGWIEHALIHFDDPDVGAVAPLVVLMGRPDLIDAAGDGYSLAGLPYNRLSHHPSASVADTGPIEVFGASASAAFYRGEVLRDLGGFNRAYGSYYEDVELAFRIRWAGYRCVFEPSCRVKHHGHASYDHRKPRLHRRVARNGERLFWSCAPRSWIAAGLAFRLAYLSLNMARGLSNGRTWSILGGLVDAWSDPGSMWRRRRENLALAARRGRSPRMGAWPVLFPTREVRAMRRHLGTPGTNASAIPRPHPPTLASAREFSKVHATTVPGGPEGVSTNPPPRP